jgi:hypothetical protein
MFDYRTASHNLLSHKARIHFDCHRVQLHAEFWTAFYMDQRLDLCQGKKNPSSAVDNLEALPCQLK